MKNISYFAAPGVGGFGAITDKKISEIEHLVCNATGETTGSIKIRSRSRNRVLSRHMIFYFLKRYTRLSLREMGERYGCLDHSTVIHGIETLGDLMHTQPALKKQVEWIDGVLKDGLIRMQ